MLQTAMFDEGAAKTGRRYTHYFLLRSLVELVSLDLKKHYKSLTVPWAQNIELVKLRVLYFILLVSSPPILNVFFELLYRLLAFVCFRSVDPQSFSGCTGPLLVSAARFRRAVTCSFQ